jgi:eukaryotic-like serine/threonine-protein kinase
MSSIIEGYAYDIFISYRQKDNKYDGWVTEFVDNLKRELESAFKEDVSVYFDVNPQDGLLETHDVDASLKKKLSCLIFIPIISRTYCDPKAYAWEHEFKAFIEQASQDQFGLRITLQYGNVANRVLPVRINDLDISDIKICESILGGVVRGVDFIYKSAGVNRPLRSKEDNPHDNLNHTIYRDQINKVALAVKDIIESMKVSISPHQTKHKEIQGKKSEEKKEIKVEELDKEEIIKPKQGVRADKIKSDKEKRFPVSRKSGILIPGIVGTIAILVITAFLLIRHYKVSWAKEKALPEIEKLYNEEKQIAAFNLVQKAAKYISKDLKFQEWASLITSKLTILTDPPGADIFIKEYSDMKGEWKKLGITPIDSLKMPDYTFYQTRIEKTGYENVLAVAQTGVDTLFRKLFKVGEIPPGMVYVEGYEENEPGNFLKEKNGFFIDKFEVTNKQFKKFVDKGGYRKPEYWKNEFIKDGKKLAWKEAMAYFTDKTGRTGPATWEAEDYPNGQEDYPVSGISWYEAAAYAEYAGKSLPTAEHWGKGTGFYIPGSKILPISNFNGKGPESVGKYLGISCFGAYDMAGNVREWCWNETPIGHIIRGGAWDDPIYLYFDPSQLPSFDRSPKNGFRCVQYIDKEKIPDSTFRLIKYIKGMDYYSGGRDFSKEEPVPDNIFTIYKNQFLYDSTDLKAVIEERINSYEDWTIEKVTYNSAYGKERVIAYLFLPRNVLPPFQTLIYWPGIDAAFEKNLIKSDWKWCIDYLLKSGHAVMYPVYKGTFERNDGPVPKEGHQLTDWAIKCCKDFKRSVDYLNTRSDIDMNKLGFYGESWGGSMGGMIPAIEDRLKVNILIVGGFNGALLPEVHAINYVSRVKIPTLMLNGRYDSRYNIDINVKPFFKLLGTLEKDKCLIIYETDHGVPKSEVMKESLKWLDKYFGPVK